MDHEPSVYLSGIDKTSFQASSYAKTHKSSHRYLAYRDIPLMLGDLQGKKAIDYGTGTGYSAQFLAKLGCEVVGVDVCEEMLCQAKKLYPSLSFQHMKEGMIPLPSRSCDLVFSSFVLFELSSPKQIISYLQEAKRVMKKEGLFLGITGSEHLHCPSKTWLNFSSGFSENKNLASGKTVKLYQYDSAIEFTDYYWREEDYFTFFAQAGLTLLKIHYPLGRKEEPYPWKDEIFSAPFVVFLAQL